MIVSIVIPTFNGQRLLATHLPSVIRSAQRWDPTGKNIEIIVVDDASTDRTQAWLLKTYPLVRVVRNEANLRFAESCNVGIEAARGEIIVLLNNDVEPDNNFLTPLVEHFKDKEIFAVGCRERNIDQDAETIGGRGVMSFQRGFMVHWRPDNQSDETTLWVSAGSSAFRKSIWEKLGGMDHLFRPAYEEDRDISWQALKAGYKLIFEQQSTVSHSHETTNKEVFGSQNIEFFSFKNQLLFVWKNISSPNLLLQHVLWLPYHLVLTTIRSKGMFLLAFFHALAQFPEAMGSRNRARRFWKKRDEDILSQTQE